MQNTTLHCLTRLLRRVSQLCANYYRGLHGVRLNRVTIALLLATTLLPGQQSLATGTATDAATGAATGAAAQWTTGFTNQFGVAVRSVPGGIAMVDIGPERLPDPQVSWGDKKILVQKNAGRWQALVGIPLTTKPGRYELEVLSTVPRKTAFTVSGKRYRQQLLTISDTSKVTPPPAALQRIKKERRRMSAARTSWRPEFDASVFQLPLQGRQSSQFGLRRLYNGRPGNRHTGLDIAAAEGTPIMAPADGVVVEVGDFYFNGQSVFLDHGQGLISLYSHLSSTDLKRGQRVQTGEVVGRVGATGRVTGPHLHWSVGLNGVWVDPLFFLPPVP